jgi:histidyl-tRNA synthetase
MATNSKKSSAAPAKSKAAPSAKGGKVDGDKKIQGKPAANVQKPAKAPVEKPAASVPEQRPAGRQPGKPVLEKPIVQGAPGPKLTGKIAATPQALRGMRDTLPSEQKFWRLMTRKIEDLTMAYGYDRIDTPVLEETALFNRSVGKQSDVIEKELFSFEDKGGDNVSLRPEGTAGVIRAYVNHGMFNQPQPVKLHYVGSMFRYDRPQAGRYREHRQFGVEVFGEAGPAQDAEIILLAHLFLKEMKLKTVTHVNSLGCHECRTNYLLELAAYYRAKRSSLCDDCKRRLARNPLRLLDCKEPSCQPVKDGAPNLVDFLDESCKNHFMRVLEFLDDLQVPYVLDPHLVRGFDYYTRTVFEIVGADEAAEANASPLSIGGGGRYDNLVELMGGRPMPACGFGIGLERVILAVKSQGVEPPDDRQPDVFLAQLGDAARRKAFNLFEEMRQQGIRAAANFSKGTLKGQLEVANRLGARFTLILGQQEILDGTIIFRDMESGMQEIVDYGKVVSELRKKMGKTA